MLATNPLVNIKHPPVSLKELKNKAGLNQLKWNHSMVIVGIFFNNPLKLMKSKILICLFLPRAAGNLYLSIAPLLRQLVTHTSQQAVQEKMLQLDF